MIWYQERRIILVIRWIFLRLATFSFRPTRLLSWASTCGFASRKNLSPNNFQASSPLLILQAKNLKKSYPGLTLLDGIDIELAAGESLAIMGPSGVGKSTLLHILGLLEKPDSGEVIICDKTCSKESIRNSHIGFIFQAFHLLEDESVLSNVLMPSKIARMPNPARARELIECVGLKGRENQLVSKLSGGEKQRVAIARAHCNNPNLILADEPTGNLDSENSKLIEDLLFDTDKALIIVTHDERLAKRCDRILTLHNAKLS